MMKVKELQEWSESSAAFHHEADVGSWQDHLRGCAEVLLVSLLEVPCPPCSLPHMPCALHEQISLQQPLIPL